MLNQKGLLLACLAVALSPAVSRAVPLAATQTVQLQPPSNVRVRPTIIGKINKSPSISCNEIVINATLHPPGGFPVGGATATLSPAGSHGCSYKITVPPELLGKKVHLWGTFKSPSPLLSIQPVGWQSPISLPQQLGISQSYDFVAKDTVIH
ncbi:MULTISPECIES: hypothetical protein [unclassified Thermosynechococcus]|uniref:hypothetical protein n=1 Tax=unclassified Thermosynechococcus TaxID=2622553 RepID=UPI00197E83DE|nr:MULTISPECIES: hypothetical protein [unclassified Thermosynechococcus]MDR5639572.1 hypothetical protein [Thermosynechococcus sp. PP42]QSF50250.1 hypothetical protein JW907_05765 [Thermosynechococcus sp. TA-1]WKT82315.1 hypothetical protein QYC27_05810 [Thermosynechococcus sp. PP45]WNC25932.1 hypothetical protein RHH26_05810 [Thermosynechococcus sp. PP551]WNC28512.1 hypothetical protein RHH27_05805 [Thermosynechococcus sp. PP555]